MKRLKARWWAWRRQVRRNKTERALKLAAAVIVRAMKDPTIPRSVRRRWQRDFFKGQFDDLIKEEK